MQHGGQGGLMLWLALGLSPLLPEAWASSVPVACYQVLTANMEDLGPQWFSLVTEGETEAQLGGVAGWP